MVRSLTKFAILHPVIISAPTDDTAFKFYTELMREKHKKIYTQDGPYVGVVRVT